MASIRIDVMKRFCSFEVVGRSRADNLLAATIPRHRGHFDLLVVCDI
jgi:hypothetical protein